MPKSSTRQGRPTPGPLLISRGVTIVGSLFYDGQIQVEGTIDGEVRCSALQITELGAVEGLIVAESVEVRGEANGSIYAEKLVLRTTCSVEGEVYHHNLVLEDGCLFEGKSRRHANPVKLAPESSFHPPELETDPLGSLRRGS